MRACNYILKGLGNARRGGITSGCRQKMLDGEIADNQQVAFTAKTVAVLFSQLLLMVVVVVAMGVVIGFTMVYSYVLTLRG